jgi:hypothetical protein
VILSAIGLALMIAERIKGFVIFHTLNISQHYLVFQCVMLLGLYTIICCKEEFDDDRTKLIRLKSFQLAFQVTVSSLIVIALNNTTHDGDTGGPAILLFIAAVGIILYLLVFHIGVHFDFLWDYNDRGVWENLKNIGKNKWGMLAYLGVCAVMFLIIALMTMYSKI